MPLYIAEQLLSKCYFSIKSFINYPNNFSKSSISLSLHWAGKGISYRLRWTLFGFCYDALPARLKLFLLLSLKLQPFMQIISRCCFRQQILTAYRNKIACVNAHSIFQHAALSLLCLIWHQQAIIPPSVLANAAMVIAMAESEPVRFFGMRWDKISHRSYFEYPIFRLRAFSLPLVAMNCNIAGPNAEFGTDKSKLDKPFISLPPSRMP